MCYYYRCYILRCDIVVNVIHIIIRQVISQLIKCIGWMEDGVCYLGSVNVINQVCIRPLIIFIILGEIIAIGNGINLFIVIIE